MKQCPECKANISDTAKFCPMCGYNIKKYEEENNKQDKMFCQECGTKLEKGTMFCTECGNKISSFEHVQNSDIFNDDFLSNIASSTSQKIEEKEIEELFSQFEYEKHVDGTYTIVGLKDKNALQYIIPEGVASIASHAFEGCNAISITLPNSIMQIGDYAFKNCFNLETINLTNNLKIIGEGAFENCEMLDIAIPKTVSRVGKDAIKNTLTDLKRKENKEEETIKKANETNIGSIRTFGLYYLDNLNTKQPIEWLVLQKKENSLFLISRYAIACKQYNKCSESVTWETCDLRKWLNNDFLNNAFTKDEQNMILNTSIHTNDSRITSGGNDTIDKVFLLSIEEVKKFFSSSERRQCQATKYAKRNGAYTSVNGNCYWWLRSPSDGLKKSIVLVDVDGDYCDGHINDGDNFVRPALWINLES